MPLKARSLVSHSPLLFHKHGGRDGLRFCFLFFLLHFLLVKAQFFASSHWFRIHKVRQRYVSDDRFFQVSLQIRLLSDDNGGNSALVDVY